LQIELQRHLPWPPNECEIAAWPTGPGNGGRRTAMVTATRTTEIQQRLDTLGKAGLDAVRADIMPNAIVELFLGSDTLPTSSEESTVWGTLDVGFDSARLYLAHQDCVVYARSVSGGGRDITMSMAEALKVEFAIAERYKRVYGIEQTDRGFRSVIGGIGQISEEALPGMLYAIIRPTLDAMTEEIERSYRFALGKIAGSSPGPLWVIGGGARLKGLTSILGDRLGVPVTFPNPDIAGSRQTPDGNHPALSDVNRPVLAGCIGLALMEARG
jgi:type IV pilus assembly protein PilM